MIAPEASDAKTISPWMIEEIAIDATTIGLEASAAAMCPAKRIAAKPIAAIMIGQ